VVGFVGEVNGVMYNGRWYKTLDSTDPVAAQSKCQQNYLPLPLGWSLASDNEDSRYVIRSYNWGSIQVVLDSGYAYYTLQCRPDSCSSNWNNDLGWSDYLSTSGSTYKPTACYNYECCTWMDYIPRRAISSIRKLLISKVGVARCMTCPAGECTSSDGG
jgi:hypothetical protein